MSKIGSHVIDSALFKDQFGTAEMRNIFSDQNLIQKWLDVEAALARAEGELGIIPKEAADEISKKARVELFDFGFLKKEVDKTGHPIVPLLRALESICENDAGQYVHWGATTQDIMDTATVLLIKEAHKQMQYKLKSLLHELKSTSIKYKDLVITGRTHGQHALPTTLGFKAAVWTSEIKRNIQRYEDCKKRLFFGQFSGAVGTLASLDKIGLKVQKKMMDDLDLMVPEIAWHTSRDSLAEFISVLGIISSTVAKIANEIICLQKTELSELEEPFVMGKIGSSTMPHKRNPMISENIVALSKIIRYHVPLAIEAMIGEHERDMRGWQTEWEFIAEACIMTDAVLQKSVYVVQDLIVNENNIEDNLYKLQGLMMSEAVMFKLAKRIGRQKAHGIVYEICMEAFENNISLEDALLKNQLVVDNLDKEEISSIINPHDYTGMASYFVDRVTED